MHRKSFGLLLLLAAAVAAAAPAAYKIESIGPCTNPEVPDSVTALLQPQGLRIVGDSGPYCDIWLSKAIPQKADSTGAEYATVEPGTFAGVITYASQGQDFRGQTIKPGTYTLRYQTMPSDGNHMGVSPTQDYFLLLPAAADKNPGTPLEYKELLKSSSQTSGTNHPVTLYLPPPGDNGALSFKQNDEGHYVLETKTKAQRGGAEADFPVSIVLIGKSAH